MFSDSCVHIEKLAKVPKYVRRKFLRKPSVEESCCSRMLSFLDLLCIFRISPDIYFLPTLAGCFWCFLLVYKLNMIGSYPNERVCLEQNKF